MFSLAFFYFLIISHNEMKNRIGRLEEEKVTKIVGDTFYSHKSEQVFQHTQMLCRSLNPRLRLPRVLHIKE